MQMFKICILLHQFAACLETQQSVLEAKSSIEIVEILQKEI